MRICAKRRAEVALRKRFSHVDQLAKPRPPRFAVSGFPRRFPERPYPRPPPHSPLWFPASAEATYRSTTPQPRSISMGRRFVSDPTGAARARLLFILSRAFPPARGSKASLSNAVRGKTPNPYQFEGRAIPILVDNSDPSFYSQAISGKTNAPRPVILARDVFMGRQRHVASYAPFHARYCDRRFGWVAVRHEIPGRPSALQKVPRFREWRRARLAASGRKAEFVNAAFGVAKFSVMSSTGTVLPVHVQRPPQIPKSIRSRQPLLRDVAFGKTEGFFHPWRRNRL